MKFRLVKTTILFIAVVVLQSCGLFGDGSEPAELTPTREYAVVPTFTSTPMVDATPTTAPIVEVATSTSTAEATEIATVALPATAELTATAELIATAQPTSTQSSEARLTVTGEIINVRSGPDTAFETIGSADKGESFAILAQSAQGDWWQICCINGQQGWIFGELAEVANAESVAIAPEMPTPVQPTPAPVAEAPTATPEPAAQPAEPPPVADNGSAGDFNPDAIYQIIHFKVLGLDENNGGIRSSGAQHLIFVTVLDQNGNGVDGAVVENIVGDHSQTVMGGKGPGKAELTMYYESFKLRVVSDPSGPVTSQVTNQMGLAFPHLPDLVGRLGGLDYEYAVCPTIDIKCGWPIQAVHYSYEVVFQKVK